MPEPEALGLAPGAPTDGTVAGTGSAAVAHGAADFGIDLDWLPEPGRTQAMSGRTAAYDDTGRCACHLAPFGGTLVDGDADGPGLIELYGHKSAGQLDGSPDARAGSPTHPTGAWPIDAPNAAEPSAEVRKRSANLMAMCERCAIGIHFRCADDHVIGHSGDDRIGNYSAKDIAAKSFLCHDCWSTHKPYVDESDEEEIESDTNPERHPNRLRWRWPGRMKEALDAAARRERAASAVVGDGQLAGDGRTARWPRRVAAAPKPLHLLAIGERPGDATSRLHCTPLFPTQPTPMVPRCVNRGRQRRHELQQSILTTTTTRRKHPATTLGTLVQMANRNLLGAGLTSRTWAHLLERRRSLCVL